MSNLVEQRSENITLWRQDLVVASLNARSAAFTHMGLVEIIRANSDQRSIISSLPGILVISWFISFSLLHQRKPQLLGSFKADICVRNRATTLPR